MKKCISIQLFRTLFLKTLCLFFLVGCNQDDALVGGQRLPSGHSFNDEFRKMSQMGLTEYVDKAVSGVDYCDSLDLASDISKSCLELIKRGKVCEKELASRLKNLPLQPGFSCAKGVRQSLNALFGKDSTYGETDPGTNALDYNEKVLEKWQTPTHKYKKVNTFKGPQDFDIRVLQPSPHCQNKMVRKYGHIEFFYKGKWYSDFQQSGSSWNNGSGCYRGHDVFRLSKK